MEQLQRRDVDVVEVIVHTEDDLKALFPEEPAVGYRRRRLRHFQNNGQESYESGNERHVEGLVEDFIKAVQYCTPAMRRRLVAVLKGLDTLESCYPVPPEEDVTEDQYRELFGTIGIEAGELRHVLRYGGLPRRVYFNRNRDVGIYFSAHGDDEVWYPSNLWEKVNPYRVQKVDHRRLNVVPRHGMATRAFRNLVLNWQKHEGQ